MELPPNLEITRKHRAAKVAVMRRTDGRVLILRRSIHDPRRAGEADFPGGEVEVHRAETDEAAALRETKQETGLDLGGIALNPLCEVEKVEDREDGARVLVIQRLFLAIIAEHDPILEISDEHEGEGSGWYSLDEATEQFEPDSSKHFALTIIQQKVAAGELPIAS